MGKEPLTYEEQLELELKNKQKKLIDSIAAKNFSAVKEGKIALDIIDIKITRLFEKMTATKPLTYEEYLSSHGRVLALRDFTSTLKGKAAENETAAEEVRVINENLQQIREDKQQ